MHAARRTRARTTAHAARVTAAEPPAYKYTVRIGAAGRAPANRSSTSGDVEVVIEVRAMGGATAAAKAAAVGKLPAAASAATETHAGHIVISSPS